MNFISPTYGVVNLSRTLDLIEDFVNEDRGAEYEFVVGTDSQKHDDFFLVVTAIMIHRVGKHARYFYCKSTVNDTMSLGERMFIEASNSLKVAEAIMEEILEKHIDIPCLNRLSIHVDIGTNGRTKEYIGPIKGMVEGCGYEFHYKPEAIVASSIADKHTKA